MKMVIRDAYIWGCLYSLDTGAFCFGKLQASTAGSLDLVVDVQQTLASIAVTFHPGTICFELKSRSDQLRARSPQEPLTRSDS